MSETPSSEPEFSGIDLANSFLPAWAKPADPSGKSPSSLVERFGDRQDDPQKDRRADRRGNRQDSRPGGRKPERGPRRRDDQGGRGRQDARRRDEQSPAPAPERVIEGWSISIEPDPRGIEGLAKQLKAGGKAYAVFDLALVILEKPERYLVKFQRTSDKATRLFQYAGDKSLWLSESEAVRHILERDLEQYYRREVVQVEPPKGAFPFVAVCGMSDTVLGPPNYHDYQNRLHKLHAERFANVPFDVFKSRIRMEKEPAFLEKWKAEQSSKEEFQTLENAEGSEPVKFRDLKEVEHHFRTNHAGALIVEAGRELEVAGPVAIHQSTVALRQLAQKSVLELRRFPLPLAHVVGRELSTKGLQIFKAHGNITYVSVARPRHLDRQNTPVAEGLSNILDYLESHQSIPRAEQWKALVAQRTAPSDEAQRDAAVAADLSWLIHQGHVIDYARKGLEAVRKPKPSSKATPSEGS